MGMVSIIDSWFYSGFERNWDDHIFRARILEVIGHDSDILDVGAGAGIVEAMNFRGLARRVCGVDLDPRVETNPFLDEGRLTDAGRLPYSDCSFDVVFADNVMEHLDEPAVVLAEISRVLRPGGKLLFKTPNRNHYMPLIARITPHRFHEWFNKRRNRETVDTFPTLYLCNSRKQVQALAHEVGMQVDRIELIEGRPEYLRLTFVTYIFGLVYERLVNASEIFSGFRVVMITTLSNPTE